MRQEANRTHHHEAVEGPPRPIERLGDEIAEQWAEGGKTRLDNLLLLCRYHHRLVHEGGIRVKLLPNGEPRFTRPTGRTIPLAPVPPVLAEDPIAVLEQGHRQEALEIHAETGLPSWDGGSWDLNWALEALRPIGQSDRRFRGYVSARDPLDEWFEQEYSEPPTVRNLP